MGCCKRIVVVVVMWSLRTKNQTEKRTTCLPPLLLVLSLSLGPCLLTDRQAKEKQCNVGIGSWKSDYKLRGGISLAYSLLSSLKQ